MKWEGYMRTCVSQYTDDPEMINDAIQETYLWLCEQQRKRTLDFLNWKGEPNKHYLRMIATSKVLDAMKYQKRRRQREEVFHGHLEAIDQAYEEGVDDGVSCSEVMEELDEYHRGLLTLVYERKWTQKKLSKELNIPYVTIKSDVKKAREHFKETWATKKESISRSTE